MDDHEQIEQLEHSLITGRIDRRAFVAAALATGLLSSQAAAATAEELGEAADNQARKNASPRSSYDYVVVGAGSAGCTLVGTLARQHPSAQILLIEAGGWDKNPAVKDPRLWFTNLGTKRDWGDVAIPSPGVNNRAIPEHTGRLIGGGSSINATIWARPFKADLEHWAHESGDSRWGYRHGLQLFKSVENWQGPKNKKFRGTGGPIWVQPAADPLPLATAALAGMKEVGLPVVDDLNGERELTGNGFGYMNQIIKNGRRFSMARAFLYPVLKRDNVTVLTLTQVSRVVIKNGRAMGVECRRDGKKFTFHADREVILSAGGFNTPKILMLSGIGHRNELKDLNIPVHVHSPEVGKNVQDHILHGGCLFEAPEPF